MNSMDIHGSLASFGSQLKQFSNRRSPYAGRQQQEPIPFSGSGKNRRATVQFAAAGQKKYVLAYSPLRPAGK